MPRNLDNRVELVVPVEDTRAQQEIARVSATLIADNADAWDLDAEGSLAPRATRQGPAEPSHPDCADAECACPCPPTPREQLRLRVGPADAERRMATMQVAVVDVGANTLRLLVAARDANGLAIVHRERVQLGLGEFIEQTGAIPPDRLEAAGRAAREQAASARRLGCSRIEIVVTSPGRQAANADRLLESLVRVRGATVRVLGAEEEASFAYRGVVASIDDRPESIAVCDVGGGSTQIAVGSCDEEPAWVRSLDLGSLRLTRRGLTDDPPTAEAIDRVREELEPLFARLTPPLPQAAYATSGSARALGKLVGPRLGSEELAVALRIVAGRPSRRLAKTFDLSPARARTLAAGALLLVCTQRLLGVPLEVARAGLGEGVALSLLADAAVAA